MSSLKGVANPSGLLVAATQMLVHLGFGSVGETIKNAWLCTLEDGIHTPDIYREGLSQEKVGTQRFTEAVIARLGKEPQHLQAVAYRDTPITVVRGPQRPTTKQLVGIDVFLCWDEADRQPEALARRLLAVTPEAFRLTLITNRGAQVYPGGLPETFCTDHWRCRFLAIDRSCSYHDILRLLDRLTSQGLEVIKTENLYMFDGQPGYSLITNHAPADP